MFSFDLSETGDPRVAAQPFLRHHPPSAIVEADCAFATLECGEEVGQRDRSAFAEIEVAVQLEPVDARFDLEPHRMRGPERRAFGLDVPALGHQGTDGAAELGDGNRVIGAGADRCKRPPESELLQPLKGLTLCGHIPPDHSPPARIEGCRAAVVRHDSAVVIELHHGAELMSVVVTGCNAAFHPHARLRAGFDDVVSEVRRKNRGIDAASRQRFNQPRRGVFGECRGLLRAAQFGEPRERVARVEP